MREKLNIASGGKSKCLHLSDTVFAETAYVFWSESTRWRVPYNDLCAGTNRWVCDGRGSSPFKEGCRPRSGCKHDPFPVVKAKFGCSCQWFEFRIVWFCLTVMFVIHSCDPSCRPVLVPLSRWVIIFQTSNISANATWNDWLECRIQLHHIMFPLMERSLWKEWDGLSM